MTDTLVDHADVQVVMVHRRHEAGGHWLEAYPFISCSCWCAEFPPKPSVEAQPQGVLGVRRFRPLWGRSMDGFATDASTLNMLQQLAESQHGVLSDDARDAHSRHLHMS